ncbi:LacI family DNA-binding transcriptional regulator [Lachnospiraceae bacterium 54-53]
MTIYDIAKAAGVSPSTVSRVINNKKGINEETRRRVQKLLEENNYICNETARGLSMQSTKIIGILLEDIRVSHHTESVYVIEQEMTRKGYTCIIFSTGRTEEQRARCIKILEQRRVDGAILMGSMFETREMAALLKDHLSNIPVVIANGYLDLPNVYGVLVDERKGVEDCVEYLARLGYKRPAFVKSEETPSIQNKLNGFLAGMETLGFSKKEALIYDAQCLEADPALTMEQGRWVTEKLVREHPEIDSIVYSVDILAVGGLMKLEELGISVPGEMGVIGINNTLYGRICKPSLTTLNNKLVETSKNASRILLDALNKHETSHKIMLFTDIVERDSTGKFIPSVPSGNISP